MAIGSNSLPFMGSANGLLHLDVGFIQGIAFGIFVLLVVLFVGEVILQWYLGGGGRGR